MDSEQRRKSGLNLPGGMCETSLRLETLSTCTYRASSSLPSPSVRTISRLSSSSSLSNKSSKCSNRFIPCRSSSRLHTFGLLGTPSPVKEGGYEAYCRLLKKELFGSDYASFSSAGTGGGAASPISPSLNMFRFNTDHSAPNSPFSPSILGNDAGLSGDSFTPSKTPRKVPKTPHDDYYAKYEKKCKFPKKLDQGDSQC